MAWLCFSRCHLLSQLLPLFLLSFSSLSAADDAPNFDVRRHLATVTRYEVSRLNSNADTSPSAPDACTPIHLNLVARHGTRFPTEKRIKELITLETRIITVLNEAKKVKGNTANIPSWMEGWESPWKNIERGGHLLPAGEEELYELGIRVRERFADLFNEEYNPSIYPLKATQVPRASASAVAFGLGLFSGNGSLGPGKHRAFSVVSESRASDISLRFFDSCQTYKAYRKSREPEIKKLTMPILDEITSAVVTRSSLNFTRQDVASLWFLCKQEAALLNITNQACALFEPNEVHLLEWTDDLKGFLEKSYGNSINYRMGIPLLKDVVQSMKQAILAKEENHSHVEKAMLRFAHAETLVPFICLLGLFIDGSDLLKIQREDPLGPLPKPPQSRQWRGSTIVPFAGNNMVVLYQCPASNPDDIMGAPHQNFKYEVQVLHNEVPVRLPACDNRDFCPFDIFEEKVVNPHLKHDFHVMCNAQLPWVDLDSNNPRNFAWKMLNFVRRSFQRKDVHDSYTKTEL